MYEQNLNVITRALRDYCREHMLEDKVLLAPTRRTGAQWRDVVALSGQPVLNLRLDTFRHLALDLATPLMAERGLRMVRGLRLEVLVDALVSEVLVRGGGAGAQRPYLSMIGFSPGMSRAVTKMLSELRVAGLSGADLEPGSFEVKEKGGEIAGLLTAYEQRLGSDGLIDYAGALRLARERLIKDKEALAGSSILVPQDLREELRGIEKEVFNAIPSDAIVPLPVDLPSELPSDEGRQPTDSMLLRWVTAPSQAPAASHDGTVRIVAAVGEVNEAREVFRSCLQEKAGLDTIEVICADPDTYLSQFYELSSRLMAAGSEDLPVTFAEGIPARYSRPGRALSAWLDWNASGNPQQMMVRMIQDGLIELPGAEAAGLNSSRLAAILRGIPIGSGMERYLSKTAEEKSGLEHRIEGAEISGAGEQDAHFISPEKLERYRQKLTALQVLEDFFRQVAVLAAAAAGNHLAMLASAIVFLTDHSRSLTMIDAYCSQALLDRMTELRRCLEEQETETAIDVRSWLADLPRTVKVLGQGPVPGCLYVSTLQSGGFSLRPHTFILGLDDSRFPGAGLQDPLLLDSERARLSGQLVTGAGRTEQKLNDLARLLARLRGKVTLTYSCQSLSDDRETFPSRILLAAARIFKGEPVTTLELDAAPSSFAPLSDETCIDMADWWTWRMCEAGPVASPEAPISENFPNIGHGLEAMRARASDAFTEYDGYVPGAGPASDCTRDESPAISASRFQVLAANPMEYFFQYVLGIRPVDDYEVSATEWLDAAEKGSLLHALFCDFMREISEEGLLPPDYERDSRRVVEMLDEYVEKKKIDKPPPPNPDVFAGDYRSLRDTALTFLDMEEEYCREWIPVACEMAVGMLPDGKGTVYDVELPAIIHLPGGRSIKVRCRLDRLDGPVKGGSVYRVGDYKTGRSKRFRDNGPFHSGRFMQPILYPLAAEYALKETLGQDVKVARFEYIFPRSDVQDRAGWDSDQLGGGLGLVDKLCDLVAAGCFPFTTDPGDLMFSDYVEAYGDPVQAAEGIQRKMDARRNAMLDPYRDLRRGGIVIDVENVQPEAAE